MSSIGILLFSGLHPELLRFNFLGVRGHCRGWAFTRTLCGMLANPSDRAPKLHTCLLNLHHQLPIRIHGYRDDREFEYRNPVCSNLPWRPQLDDEGSCVLHIPGPLCLPHFLSFSVGVAIFCFLNRERLPAPLSEE